MQIFIKRDGAINGPYTERQIKMGIKTGKLTNDDLISKSKNGPWKRVQDTISKNPQTSSATIGNVTDDEVSSWIEEQEDNRDVGEIEIRPNTPLARSPEDTFSNSQVAEDEITEQTLSKSQEGGISDETPTPKSESFTKICPFCAEEIKAAAIKCKHCGEHLDSEPKDSAEEEDAVPVIRSFDTKVSKRVLDDAGESTVRTGFYEDEASCQIKFKCSGSFLIVAGPVLKRADGKEFFIEGEYGVNSISGDKDDAFQANVDFSHRNWNKTPIRVRAYRAQNQIPICERPPLTGKLVYAGLDVDKKALFGFGKIRLVLANGYRRVEGDWFPLDQTSMLEWEHDESKHMSAKIQMKDTKGFAELTNPQVPYPTVITVVCTDAKRRFRSSPDPDINHSNVTLIEGEIRFKTLTVISGA